MASLFALSLAGFFALLGWLSTQVWFYTGLGVRPYISLDLAAPPVPNDALALLLFLLVRPFSRCSLRPFLQGFRVATNLKPTPMQWPRPTGRSFSTALLKLYEDNASTLTPDPVWRVKFYYSHPPATERLARMPSSAQP